MSDQDAVPDAEPAQAVPTQAAPTDTGPTQEAVGLHTHPLTAVTTGSLFALPAVLAIGSSLVQGGDLGSGSVLRWILLLLASLVGGLVVGTGIGYLGWYFTRYVIDGTELRITSGVLTKASRRIPYERIQSVDIAEPLLARLLGLAELRIEMAGGTESRSVLRFFALRDAQQLRRVLLARAHGGPVGADVDVEEHRRVIVRVPAHLLVVGTLLTAEVAVSLAAAAALLAAALWYGQVLAFVGGVLPVATWVVRVLSQRVVAQWGFTLSEGERGLRIERGLLARSSQSIPFERVQGVAVEEPLVWRRLGWVRLEVDVAGHAASSGDDSGAAGSTLLPIGSADLAASVLRRVVPGAQPSAPVRTAASPRSRLFAPVGWRYRWVAADEQAFVASEGWVMRRTNVVPHHKTQSVEVRQGPLQRRLGLATLEVHTPQGPVDADGRHLPAEAARSEALAQLARARAARA